MVRNHPNGSSANPIANGPMWTTGKSVRQPSQSIQTIVLHSTVEGHLPWNFLAHFFDFSLGGGFLGIRKSALIGWRSHKGGWDSAISRAVIPRDQRSLRLSYVASGFSSHAITSGAIQYGVPMNVLRRPIVRSNCALTPKSTVIKTALVTKLWNEIETWKINSSEQLTSTTQYTAYVKSCRQFYNVLDDLHQFFVLQTKAISGTTNVLTFCVDLAWLCWTFFFLWDIFNIHDLSVQVFSQFKVIIVTCLFLLAAMDKTNSQALWKLLQ